jgi:hypothetical protein
MGPGHDPKLPTHQPYIIQTMTLDLALSLLRRGKNGSEILSILDGLADGQRIAQEGDA